MAPRYRECSQPHVRSPLARILHDIASDNDCQITLL